MKIISKIEYNILCSLKTDNLIDSRFHDEINTLLQEKLIYYNVINETSLEYECKGYKLTPLGERAIEDYERVLMRNEREEEANELSKEANRIAQKSDNKSKWALGVSIVSALIAFASFIFNFFK